MVSSLSRHRYAKHPFWRTCPPETGHLTGFPPTSPCDWHNPRGENMPQRCEKKRATGPADCANSRLQIPPLPNCNLFAKIPLGNGLADVGSRLQNCVPKWTLSVQIPGANGLRVAGSGVVFFPYFRHLPHTHARMILPFSSVRRWVPRIRFGPCCTELHKTRLASVVCTTPKQSGTNVFCTYPPRKGGLRKFVLLRIRVKIQLNGYGTS